MQRDDQPETPIFRIPVNKWVLCAMLKVYIMKLTHHSLSMSLSRGDLILFDIRLRHRGTPNSSPRARAIGYFSFVHEWYHDAVNFKDSQTAAFDDLDLSAKKLLRRQDRTAYVHALEFNVGPDSLVQLQSKGNYKRAELVA